MFVPSLSWQTIVVWRISKHTFIRNRELTPFVKCICYTIVFCTYARTQKCTRRMISHVPKSKLLADCSTDVHLPWVGSNQCNCSHGLPGSAATGADTDASSLFIGGGFPAVLFVPSLSWQSDRDSQEKSFSLIERWIWAPFLQGCRPILRWRTMSGGLRCEKRHILCAIYI